MKKIIIASVFFASSSFAGQEFDMLPVIETEVLSESRGMMQLYDQENETAQGGIVAGNGINNSLTGFNAIAPGAFVGAKGIMLINLNSGNANITNMSASVNVITAK